MKKKLILLCLGVFILCGCEMKEETTLTINEDKTMEIQMSLGFDDELIDSMMSLEENNNSLLENNEVTNENDELINEDNLENSEMEDTVEKTYTDEERKEYIEKDFNNEELNKEELKKSGFSIEVYQDDKYTGYLIKKKINNIDDLVGEPDFNLEDISEISNKKMFAKDGNKYKGKIIISNTTSNEENNSDSELSSQGVNTISSFILKLPTKALSNNATTVSEDQKTLTWDLTKENISAIEFEFEFQKEKNMFIMAGIAVAAILIIVIIITLVIKKSKKKKANDDLSNNNITNQPLEKNDIQTIETTQINQQLVNQEQNQQQVINITETQPQITTENQMQFTNQTKNMIYQTSQQTIQQQEFNQPISQVPVIPVIQPQEPVTQMPEQIINQNTIVNATQEQQNNEVPIITPIESAPINVQPVIQQPVQPQFVNPEQPLTQTTTEVQQNNFIQPENQNINNQQGI